MPVLTSRLQAALVPLRTGATIRGDIERADQSGILIRTRQGRVRLNWAQVHPSYYLHPTNRPASAEPAPVRPAIRSESRAREERGNQLPLMQDSFSFLLAAGFLLFWLHMISVWIVSRREAVSGPRYQTWNLATLVFGVPVAILFLIKYRNVTATAAPATHGRPAAPASGACLFTWDNQPLKTANRKLASGLTTAQDILLRAVRANASDVHLNTSADGIKVAMRVDGVLRTPETLATDLGRKTMAAIKMAAGLDMGKLYEAQDGAFHIAVGGQWYDLRLARAHAVSGETLVVRLLKAGGMGTDLTDFGVLPAMVQPMEQITSETAGIIILAGPTGSGKTSTIYALLRRIEGTGRNILTIEDPVEYRLSDATQISLSARIGTTFAQALKASLRHDPDVILVGEIRDAEAMDVAFQAALTGHLVFTTVHASSVLATFGRLRELGLSAYMINTGLKVVICQRLIRMLCPTCRETYFPDPDELAFWGLTEENSAGHCFYRPVGCHLCEESGFHGRRGVFRMLTFNNEVRTVLREELPTGELQQMIERHALGRIHEYVHDLLWTGVTSASELRKTLDMFDHGKQLGAKTDADTARVHTATDLEPPAQA